MKTLRAPQQVRKGAGFKKFDNANGRTAVIVTIPVSKRKQDLGIQFWTKGQIEAGQSANSDSSVSRFVEIY